MLRELWSLIKSILIRSDDEIDMKKKWLLLLMIPVIIILVVVIIFLVERSKVELYEIDGGTAISVIGGADGPTSIFIAGKMGDNDSSESNDTVQETQKMQIEIQIGESSMIAELEDNIATEELIDLLESGEIVMPASNYGGFEKVCSIGQSISRADEQITTEAGDIMLYSGNQLVIFYDSNSWSYTPIGHIDASADELEEFLSGDDSEVIIRLVE